MATNIYTGSSYTPKRKGRGFFKFFFFMLILSGLGYLGYFVYEQRDRFLFYFQKNKYLKLKEKLKVAETFINNSGKITESSEVNEVEKLLNDLAVDHPTDHMVFFFRGRLYFRMFYHRVNENQVLYKDLFFTSYLDRYQFPPELNEQNWNNALISLRKALALGLPDEYRLQAREALSLLYLWGGKAYYPSGAALLSNNKEALSLALFNILLGRAEPEWPKLEKKFDKQLVKFWMALYFLRTGNEPRGFSNLKDLAGEPEREEKADIILQNNARYLLGHIMKTQKKWQSQLKNWQTIEFKEFLARHPWFLKEYNYLLRYLGKKKEASIFLSRFEKQVLQKKSVQ